MEDDLGVGGALHVGELLGRDGEHKVTPEQLEAGVAELEA
jgi:hypothetical protein